MIPAGAPVLTAAAMRAAEDASGVVSAKLMERAGLAVAQEVRRIAGQRAILMLAGPGKNGGDARIAARHLALWGHDVTVSTDAQLSGVPPRTVLVDGLFGTGLSRPLAQADELARLARAAETVVAIDLPSGLDADSGDRLGAVACDVTVALGALKPAHVVGDGAALCGDIVLRTIEIDAASDWTTLSRPALAPPDALAHKFSRGMVAVVGGAMPGAALLAARAAMRGGAGYVVLTGAAGGPDALVHRELDDALLADQRIGAIVVGPGLGRDDAARAKLERVLASDRPLVIDGDALTLLGADAARRLRARAAASILTPHAGEFARMFGEGAGSKIARTLSAAAASGCVVVAKGSDTVVGYPDGRCVVAASAPSWLASAGTGDMLAGLVGARMAAGGRAEEAVWLHGRAAALAGPALIADDLIATIPAATGECL